MLRRRETPLTRVQKLAQRARRMAAMAAGVHGRPAVMGGSTSGEPELKTEPYRDPALLEMARGRPCLLMVPAICNHRVDTTSAAHSNWAEHGKAGARKADDCYSVWSCAACHIPWLDQGRASGDLKLRTFMEAHARQVLAWRLIAMDEGEPERFRRAARRALEHLQATPIGDAP